MACSATIEGKRVIGQFTTDAEWATIKKLSKQRMVFMPDTGLPAVAKTIRRSGLVTRFFSHFPGEAPEGYTSNESPEHMALKLAVYSALLRDGYTREVYCPVCGRGIGSYMTGKVLTGIELTACPVATNALVDARPVLRLQPKWFVTKIAGRSTPVMQKAEWQARFSEPLKAAMFGVSPKEGSHRYWAWHKIATARGIIDGVISL